MLCLDRECRLNLRKRRRNRLCKQSYVFLFLPPLLRNYRSFGVSPITLRLPVILRETAGEDYRNLTTTLLYCFLTPPSFGHLPYILCCKTQGRSETSLFYCCFGFSVTTYRLSYILLRATPQCCGVRQRRSFAPPFYYVILPVR